MDPALSMFNLRPELLALKFESVKKSKSQEDYAASL